MSCYVFVAVVFCGVVSCCASFWCFVVVSCFISMFCCYIFMCCVVTCIFTLSNVFSFISSQCILQALAPVVRKADNAIHRINHYPADNVVCFVNTYRLDSDLSTG